MWAMIPMLRVFSRVYLRGMGRLSLSAESADASAVLRRVRGLRSATKKRALSGPDPAHGDTRRTGLCLEGLHGNGSAPWRDGHTARALAPERIPMLAVAKQTKLPWRSCPYAC